MRDEWRRRVCPQLLYPRGFLHCDSLCQAREERSQKALWSLYSKDSPPAQMLLMPGIKMVNEGLPTSLPSSLLSWGNPYMMSEKTADTKGLAHIFCTWRDSLGRGKLFWTKAEPSPTFLHSLHSQRLSQCESTVLQVWPAAGGLPTLEVLPWLHSVQILPCWPRPALSRKAFSHLPWSQASLQHDLLMSNNHANIC